jgi:hypothetical protein
MWLDTTSGDSLVAWDVGQNRLSFFTASGRLVRTATINAAEGRVFPEVHGRFADVTFLLASGFDALRVMRPGKWRDTISYFRIGPDGEIVDTVGQFPGTERYAPHVRGNEGIFQVRSVPFGRRTMTAVHGDRFYVTKGDAFEIDVYRHDGSLVSSIRQAHNPLRVTAEDIERYKANSIAANASRNGASAIQYEQMLANAPYPTTFPPLADLLVDTGGNIWARMSQQSRTQELGSRWVVFDTDGCRIGVVNTPPKTSILQATEQRVLVVTTDQDGVEHVHLYGLERLPKPTVGCVGNRLAQRSLH